MLVQSDVGYRMGAVEHHEYDQHLYIIAGTFVDEYRASGTAQGPSIRHTKPDGCTFLAAVPRRLRQS
jgi:hypothetical protein